MRLEIIINKKAFSEKDFSESTIWCWQDNFNYSCKHINRIYPLITEN